jgi:AhpD family alkylhydroperoxidase
MNTEPRVNYAKLAPQPLRQLAQLSHTVREGRLGKRLVDLVYLRVSQINGCAFCIDMHWADLIKLDVEPRHLNAVAGWREAPFFSERERAALQWAEVVTLIPQRDPSDADFAALKAHFDDAEIAELGFAIAAINGWNRMNVAFRMPLPAEPYHAGAALPGGAASRS